MSLAFAALARVGKNGWWRYLLAFVTIFFFWLFLGSAILFTIVGFSTFRDGSGVSIDSRTGLVSGTSPLLNFIALNFGFIMLIAGLFVALRYIHQRPFLTIITLQRGINWARMAQGALTWTVLAVLATLLDAIIHPGRYQVTFAPTSSFAFLPVILLLTPIQTTAEELFFRGYLLQTLYRVNPGVPFLIFFNALLFMLPHLGNPEMATHSPLLALYYFSFGVFATYITLRDNSNELTIGLHAANNLFTAIFANYANSALQTPAIFTSTTLDPIYNLASFVVMAIIFYIAVFRHHPLPSQSRYSHPI